jgi:CheY-like chemotaxis protein
MVAATGSKRVLVVDDEEIVRQSYKLALTDAGYDVSVAANGHDAIEACRTEHFDVMLADIRMPDMDGLEVAQIMAREFPDVRVIVITGYPSPESAARARQLGLSDYLQKPIAPDRLSAATAAALARPMERVLAAAAPQIPMTQPAAATGQTASTAGGGTAPVVALQDISPYTAFTVLLSSPMIGLAYFLLFPFVATAIAVTVLGKELARLIGELRG